MIRLHTNIEVHNFICFSRPRSSFRSECLFQIFDKFDLFDQKLLFAYSYLNVKSKLESSFSAKMNFKILSIAVMLFIVCAPCEEHLWKGHRIFCCANGTKLESKEGPVWSITKPLLCSRIGITQAAEPKENKALYWLLVGGLSFAAVFCWLQYVCRKQCWKLCQREQA